MFTRRCFFFFIAAMFLNGATMAAGTAGSLDGSWKLDGAFSSSGETMTATIVALPQHQWRLVLPKDVRPEGMVGEIVLHQSGDNIYVSTAATDVKIRVTVTAIGKADLSIKIDNTKGFARFGYGMTRIGH
jgi:hypothetical protein